MKTNISAAMLAAMLLLYSAGAAAQLSYVDPVTNQGILDQVVTAFGTRAAAWQAAVMSAASWLFWTLGTISFTWTMGMLALKKADIGDFFTELIRFTLFFGFFYWLLQNGPSFAHTITDSLMTIGSSASTAAGSSGTAANLAQGSWDVAKAKTGEMKDAALDRIGETTGGKIAAAIKASSNQEPAFSGDSLGAGNGGSNANDEVAAFANRTNGGGGEIGTSTASGTSGKQSGTTTASTRSAFD